MRVVGCGVCREPWCAVDDLVMPVLGFVGGRRALSKAREAVRRVVVVSRRRAREDDHVSRASAWCGGNCGWGLGVMFIVLFGCGVRFGKLREIYSLCL